MVEESDGEPRRRHRWPVLAGALVVAVSLALAVYVLAAPGVEATCDKLSETVERAGETVEPTQREHCLQALEADKRARGRLRWAASAWCVRRNTTVRGLGTCGLSAGS